jgi:hypothetical protein
MSDIKHNDTITHPEDDSNIENLTNDLKNLPRLVVPDNFEYNLKIRISNLEPNQKPGLIDRLFFPTGDTGSKRIIFSTVMVLICCSIILGYLVIRHFNNMNNQNVNSLDSTYYEGKKVIILPPTSPPSNDKTAEQPLHKYIQQKSSEIDQETLKRYIVPSTRMQEQVTTGLAITKPDTDSSKIQMDATKEVGGVNMKKAKKSTTKDTKKPLGKPRDLH